MSKRTIQTNVTPLPSGISRKIVLDFLHDHIQMIDLNPLVESRTQCKPPAKSTPEEYNATWYELVDKISYLPGGLYSGRVTYHACFHDLPEGLQTHCYAPMGLDIKEKWSVGGSLPGEPKPPMEMGLNLPKEGLYLREDIDMRCNLMVQSIVKKNLKNSHKTLVDRLIEKAHVVQRDAYNETISSVSTNDRGDSSSAYSRSDSIYNQQQRPLSGPGPQSSQYSAPTYHQQQGHGQASYQANYQGVPNAMELPAESKPTYKFENPGSLAPLQQQGQSQPAYEMHAPNPPQGGPQQHQSQGQRQQGSNSLAAELE